MKTNKLILGTLAAFAMLSCAKENPVLPSQDTPLEQDEIRFVNISIGSPSSLTKADDYPDYNAGEGYENEVKDVHLLFFDKSGNRVGAITTISEDTWIVNSNDPKVPNVNRYYAKATQVSLRRGENLPSYVMAFVNAISGDLTGEEFSSLANIERHTLSKTLYSVSKDGFAMSNSVYYGKDAVTGAADSKIMATPISLDQLFSSEADAEKEFTPDSSTKIVDIYVERYAAKVQFGFNFAGKENAIKAIEIDEGEITLTFVPEAWAINADEDESYITKSFFASREGIESNTAATLAQMNSALSGWDFWNHESNHRSYWAQSPNYWETAYPRVSDEIIDEVDDYKLKYYSYKEIIDNSNDEEVHIYNRLAKAAPSYEDGQSSSNVLYARENTVDASAFSNSLNPKAAVPSIVLVGRYKVNGEFLSGDEDETEDDIFYLKGNYSEGTLKYFDKAGMYADFLANQGLLFSDETGTKLTYEDADAADALTIEHPAKDVRGEFLTDSRYVTLQLTESAKTSENIFTYDDAGEIKSLKDIFTGTNTDLDALNSLLWQEVGSVRGYKDGRAYFYIPVKHLGFSYLNEQDETNPNSADFDWSKVKSGAFGLVRNHYYNVEVTGISGVGSGIPSEDIPIVPPLDDEDYYIAARINILNWAVVPKQEVEL